MLAQNEVLSAPVLDSRTREYVGFVDVKDILRGIMLGTRTPWVLAHAALGARDTARAGGMVSSVDWERQRGWA